MRTCFLLLVAPVLFVCLAHADADDLSGGVLLVHAPPGVVYTSGTIAWCDSTHLADCEDQVNTIAANTEAVWFVLSAWAEEKTFSAVEFGLGDFDPESFIFMADGVCLDEAMAIHYPSVEDWPGPNTGIAIASTEDGWTGDLVPLCWFAAYNYAEADTIAITENPATGNAGWVSGESWMTYDAECLGALGLGADGIPCCPGGEDEGSESEGGEDSFDEQSSEGGLDSGGPGWIDLGGEPFALDLVESDGETSVIELTVGGFFATPIEIEEKTYYRITLAEEPLSLEACQPELPYIPRSLIIPNDQSMTFSILESDYVDLPDLPIVPSKGPLSMGVDADSVPYCFGSAYESDSLYPAESIMLGTPYVLRDFRGLVAQLSPFQAMPVSDSLRVYTHMVVEISPAGLDDVNVLDREGLPDRIDRQFALLYRNHFLNYNSMCAARNYIPIEEDGPLLIITHDDFYDAMLPLLAWKRQRGLQTEMLRVSDISDPPDTNAIHQYISARCNPPDSVAYVLLVGDCEQMPSKILWAVGQEWSRALSDPSYTLKYASPSDYYPDLFLGRFSAHDVSQVETQVQRTIEYERDTGSDSDWLGRAFAMADTAIEAASPWTTLEWMVSHLQTLRAYGYDTTSYYGTVIPRSSGDPQPVIDAFENGMGVFLASADGAPNGWDDDFSNFKLPQVANLTNDNMLPLIHAHSCNLGRFSEDTCFAEGLMWATHNGEPTGAIGTYMASRQMDQPGPQWAQYETVRLLTTGAAFTMGGLIYNGVCLYIQRGGLWGFRTWTLFGDPSLVLHTDAPDTMVVEHDGYLLPEDEEYRVSVRGASTEPVVGACCALYCPTTMEIWGVATTDETGDVIFSPPAWPTDLTLTVTAQNRVTYVGAIRPRCVVTPNGNGDFATIQAAIDATCAGGVIVLADGQFSGAGNWDLECHKAVTIMSESGDPLACCIDCAEPDSSHFGIAFAPSGLDQALVLKSLKIRNGWRSDNTSGGAVRCYGTPPGVLEAENCIFADSHARRAGGVYCAGDGTLSGCTFLENGATQDGGGLTCLGNLTLSHCTFAGNSAQSGGGISCGGQVANISNTIVADSDAGGALACQGEALAFLTCCDLWGNEGGDWTGCIAEQFELDGNLSENPQFCAPYYGDYHISYESPCHQGEQECGLIGAWAPACGNSGAEEALELAPTRLDLGPIWPTPGVGDIHVVYSVPCRSNVRISLTIYDLLGRRVRNLVDGQAIPGVHRVVWDGRDDRGMTVPSGTYFSRLETGGEKVSRPILILR